jgi:hypothetical protein
MHAMPFPYTSGGHHGTCQQVVDIMAHHGSLAPNVRG